MNIFHHRVAQSFIIRTKRRLAWMIVDLKFPPHTMLNSSSDSHWIQTKKTDIIQQKRICFRWKTWVKNAWKRPCIMRIKPYFIHFWLKHTPQKPYFTFCRKHRTFLKKTPMSGLMTFPLSLQCRKTRRICLSLKYKSMKLLFLI